MKTNKTKLFKPNVPKNVKNLSWPQAKARFPHMKAYGDADKDGLKNFRDCKPFDWKRKGEGHEEKLKKWESFMKRYKMRCPECGKVLTEEDNCGHDCE